MPSPLQKKSKVKLCWASDNEYKKTNGIKEPLRILKNSASGNLLFHSDNLTSVNYLLENGFEQKIDLVYIDPPFGRGEKYYHRMKNVENPAFEDVFRGKIDEYLDMIYPRLEVIQKLISARGSIFVHLDWHLLHYVKVIMDEIFGYENFRNEIIIKRGRRKNLLYQFKSIDRMHVANDSILWYSKSAGTKFHHPLVKNKRNSKWMGFWSNVNRPTMRYELFGFVPERGQWKWSKARALLAIENYKVYVGKFADIPLEEYWRRTRSVAQWALNNSTLAAATSAFRRATSIFFPAAAIYSSSIPVVITQAGPGNRVGRAAAFAVPAGTQPARSWVRMVVRIIYDVNETLCK